VAFNAEAAKKVVDAVLEAMAVSADIDPGYTRHAPKLPDIIKQTEGWEVDLKELEKFEKVIKLLVCSIFGIDCDGDRSLNWVFVSRKDEETILPSFVVPRVRHGDSEEKHWQQLTAIHANLKQWQTAYDTSLRIYEFERMHNKRKETQDECGTAKETS